MDYLHLYSNSLNSSAESEKGKQTITKVPDKLHNNTISRKTKKYW
jgi:hypothetical protein